MTQKIFLTSALAMGFVAPAMAITDSNSFPNASQGEYMQADTRYINAATSTNMDGVYEGTVNAVAQYTDVLYNIVAGRYLEGESEATNGTECPAGSWCPGLTNATYSANDQGINTCPNGYTNSVAGSSANTDCYRTCATTDITHATAITGNVYFNGTNGDGVKACTPTACDNGYHPKSATPNLTTVIGTSEAGTGYTSNDSTGSDYDTDGMSNSVISGDSMAFAVDYGNKGMIKGHGRCSTRAGANDTWTNTYNVIQDNFVTDLTNQTGQSGAQYCYCHLDSYTPVSGSAIALSGPWVFASGYGDAGDCADLCAINCALNLRNGDSRGLAFRAAVFGSLGASPAMCEANTITINWNGTTETEINANNAGTATYGSDIRTPRSATPVPGKTFTGWRFVAPEQTNLSD